MILYPDGHRIGTAHPARARERVAGVALQTGDGLFRAVVLRHLDGELPVRHIGFNHRRAAPHIPARTAVLEAALDQQVVAIDICVFGTASGRDLIGPSDGGCRRRDDRLRRTIVNLPPPPTTSVRQGRQIFNNADTNVPGLTSAATLRAYRPSR